MYSSHATLSPGSFLCGWPWLCTICSRGQPAARLAHARIDCGVPPESNGNKASVKKIGILFHDDQSQKRWSLNFSDPKVLAEIDLVFITLAQTDEEGAQPKGKRMLTAYLGTAPNHHSGITSGIFNSAAPAATNFASRT
jgi:hypothetical protein